MWGWQSICRVSIAQKLERWHSTPGALGLSPGWDHTFYYLLHINREGVNVYWKKKSGWEIGPLLQPVETPYEVLGKNVTFKEWNRKISFDICATDTSKYKDLRLLVFWRTKKHRYCIKWKTLLKQITLQIESNYLM